MALTENRAASSKKSPENRGFFIFAWVQRSVPGDHRTAPAVVDADPQNVVGDVRIVAGGHEVAARRHHRGDEGSRDVAEVDIEVLDLGGPVAADHAFEAGAD